MIPYFQIPVWTVGPFHIAAFPLLVGIAILVNFRIMMSRATAAGLPASNAANVFLAALVGGFAGSHLTKLLVYEPGRLAANPVLLLRIFDGSSSFGAIAGACLAGYLLWVTGRVAAAELLAYAEHAVYGMPASWMIGRMGCALAHDHIGVRSQSWLAVAYPGGARWNLGLIEVLFHAALFAAFLALGRKPRPLGFFTATFLLSYGVFRFFLDFLHETAPQYFGWPVDRWLALVLIGAGLCAWHWMPAYGPGESKAAAGARTKSVASATSRR